MRNSFAVLIVSLTLGSSLRAQSIGDALGEPDSGSWFPWSHNAHGWATLSGRYSLAAFSPYVLAHWNIAPSRANVVNACAPALEVLAQKFDSLKEDMLYLYSAQDWGTCDYQWNPEQKWVDGKNVYDSRSIYLSRRYDPHGQIPFNQSYIEKVGRLQKAPSIFVRNLEQYKSEAWIPRLTHINFNYKKSPAPVPPLIAEPTLFQQAYFRVRLLKHTRTRVGGSDLYWVDTNWQNLDGWCNPTSGDGCNRFYFWMDYWSGRELDSQTLLGGKTANAQFWSFTARNETLGYNVWVDGFLQ